MPHEEFLYDRLAYSNTIFAQTHPDRAAGVAKLFGFDAAGVEMARVLDLGCGNGLNLIAQAYTLPKAEFVGVDLGESHIALANKCKKELKTENVEFYQRDFMDMSAEEFGKFDYIFAHGILSWVPDFVKTKIFEIYAEMLSENGIGYLSYNTFPAWNYIRVANEIAKIHTRNIDDPVEKVEEALNFIRFLEENLEAKDVYKACVTNQLVNMEKYPIVLNYYDSLADINDPFYFFEFAETLEKYGLKYIAEADLSRITTQKLSPEANQKINEIDDKIWRNQYIDFFKGTSFRQSLFTRNGADLSDVPSLKHLDSLYFASMLEAVSPNPEIQSRKVEKFELANGGEIQIDHPLTKCALLHLQKIWGNAILFTDLLEHAKNDLQELDFQTENWESEFEAVRNIFMQLILHSNFIEIHSYQDEMDTTEREKPEVRHFSKWLLKQDAKAIAKYNRLVEIEDPLLFKLCELANGKNSKEEITEDLRGFLELREDYEDKEEMLENLADDVSKHLQRFTKMGLFV